MPATVNHSLVEEILGGDQVLLPEEAAAQLGIDPDQLYELLQRGGIVSLQPGGPGSEHRYRQSAVDTARAARCLRCRKNNHCVGATVNCDCGCT